MNKSLFIYVINALISFLVGLLIMYIFDFTGEETIVLIGLLFISYNQYYILKDVA